MANQDAMDRGTVAPSFQDRVRRTFSVGSTKHNHNHNGGPHESSSLLGPDANGGDGGHAGHSETFEFFFDTHYTPGTDSANPAVKVSANIWHIVKVTLLSSK